MRYLIEKRKMADDAVVAVAVDDSKMSNNNNNPLAKKLNKILEGRLDNDKDTLKALSALSSFFTENSLRTRRNLRSDIEKRSLQINEEFLHSFKQMNDSLEAISTHITSMNDFCVDMSGRLATAKTRTKDLIEQTTKLRNESQQLSLRQEVVDAFLRTYQLTVDELKALRGGGGGGTSVGLSVAFFDALRRAKSIHADCKVLLRTNRQTAGIEIMEQMALVTEAAYERLYRWTQGECRMQTGDCPEVPQLVCQAVAELEERPVLFCYCVDEFAGARRAAVVRAFIDALTRGTSGGSGGGVASVAPRPIELHSHDPLRYVGDMLAWIHQASASEKEHLESLLRLCTPHAVEERFSAALCHVMESVCRPLRVRLEQVVVSEPGAVVLYRVANLLRFYRNTIGTVLGSPEAALPSTLHEMHVLCHGMFLNSVQCQSARLLEKPEAASADLGATDAVHRSMALLRDVLDCHDNTVASPDDRQRDFARILELVVDPLLQSCALSASRLTPADAATFLVNCGHHVQSTLALFHYTDKRLEMLAAQAEAHLDALVAEQAGAILTHTGIGALAAEAQRRGDDVNSPMARRAGADALAVRSAMARFDAFLASPDSLLLCQLALLQSATLRQRLRRRSMELVCAAYEIVYSACADPASGYAELPASLVPRTPGDVCDLLL